MPQGWRGTTGDCPERHSLRRVRRAHRQRHPRAASTARGAQRVSLRRAAPGARWRRGGLGVDRARGRGGHLDEMTAQPAPPLHTCTSHVARHASATAWMDRTRTPAHSAARGRTPALGGARTHRGGNAGGVGRAHAAPQHHGLWRRLPLLVQLSVHSPPHTRRALQAGCAAGDRGVRALGRHSVSVRAPLSSQPAEGSTRCDRAFGWPHGAGIAAVRLRLCATSEARRPSRRLGSMDLHLQSNQFQRSVSWHKPT